FSILCFVFTIVDIVGVKMSPFESLIRNPERLSYVESLRLMDEIWRREERKDVVLMVVIKQIELLESCMMGFHIRYQQANQGYWYPYNENQGRSSDCTAEMNSQESEEFLLIPH
ncbi:hypothetical protein HAX54_019625, partial [Datura stramonium]|nr:hypothetical protein [Datura stramonium]